VSTDDHDEGNLYGRGDPQGEERASEHARASLIFARGGLRKTLIDPFSPESKAKPGCVFYAIESLLRYYGVQDLNELSLPNIYNGSELITTWGIVDNRNGNEVSSIFQIRHRTL
jgi:hypothetical protein